jgi:hypothetical protein
MVQEAEREPEPVEGCDVCAACAADRKKARQQGLPLTVRSCNAVIEGHPHGRADV